MQYIPVLNEIVLAICSSVSTMYWYQDIQYTHRYNNSQYNHYEKVRYIEINYKFKSLTKVLLITHIRSWHI